MTTSLEEAKLITELRSFATETSELLKSQLYARISLLTKGRYTPDQVETDIISHVNAGRSWSDAVKQVKKDYGIELQFS